MAETDRTAVNVTGIRDVIPRMPVKLTRKDLLERAQDKPLEDIKLTDIRSLSVEEVAEAWRIELRDEDGRVAVIKNRSGREGVFSAQAAAILDSVERKEANDRLKEMLSKIPRVRRPTV